MRKSLPSAKSPHPDCSLQPSLFVSDICSNLERHRLSDRQIGCDEEDAPYGDEIMPYHAGMAEAIHEQLQTYMPYERSAFLAWESSDY